MTKETEEAVDQAIEKNNEYWKAHVKSETERWHEMMWLCGVLTAMTFFAIGWLVGAKVGM